MNTIRIGTRGSNLALTQAEYVQKLLKSAAKDITIELIKISTKGDRDRASSLASIGGTGAFTKSIETELLNNNIDIAVHSAKDLPSVMTEGLAIGAIPTREITNDVLLSRDRVSIDDLRQGAVIGTGSPRRKAMALNYRPDLHIEEIRGNVETRLQKLDDGVYDAIIMARAGLKRLNLEERICQNLPPDVFLPAPGQGALIVQIRQEDAELKAVLSGINDSNSHRCVMAERLLLNALNVGCSAAVGGLAKIKNNKLRLEAVVLDSRGTKKIHAEGESDSINNDAQMVHAIAEQLFSQGAEELIG